MNSSKCSRRSNAHPSRARAHTHTHTHTHTANRGSAVVAGLASGAQKRWNRRFPRLSFCQVSSRCCHQSTVDQSSPAKTGGWRKDFGHLVPGAYCHVRKSGGSLHETHLSKRANFIAATVHVKPVLCICAARLSGKTRIGNYVASVLTLVPDKRGVPWSKPPQHQHIRTHEAEAAC